MSLRIVPVSLKMARAFVALHHRHNAPPTGWKFGAGVMQGEFLVGVATAGRPVARALDDGFTLEVNRTCTDGSRNANSMLYGAIWKAAKALGYTRLITYTQADESGASLRAVGFVRAATLPARGSWSDSTADPRLRAMRDAEGTGGVDRVRWEMRADHCEATASALAAYGVGHG